MRRTTSTLAIGLLVMAACGGSDSEPQAGTAAVTDAAPVTAPAATEPPVTGPAPTEPATTEAPPATDPATTEAPTTEAPVATDAAPPDLEIAGPGPYEVGVQTITITDEARGRPLTVDVWFPVTDAPRPLHRYTLLPGVYYESPTAVDAAPADIAPGGPFPLVVYSHGSGGLRYIASYYTEAIASYGYIVAAPDHTGNTAVDRLAGTETDRAVTAFNRPLDVEAVIDAMTDPESAETVGFVAAVDPERIAVTGHSFGGFTALAMASGFDNELGSVEPDGRVDAIIPLAPAVGSADGGLLSDSRLASITTPMLVLVGTDDQTTPVDPNVTRIADLAPSVPLRRVELVDAEHQSFTDLCDYEEFLPSLADVPEVVTETIAAFAVEGCSPGDMPIARAKELTGTFAVNFLEAIFRGAELYGPDNVTAPADAVLTDG